MNFRQSVALDQAFQLINHGPVLLISAMHEGVRNIMAVSWSMPIDYSPMKLALILDKKTWTRKLIEGSGEFAISVPTCSQLEMLHHIGTTSGEGIYEATGQDKIAQLAIPTLPSSVVKAPLIKGCVAWLECRLLPKEQCPNGYDLFTAEVLAASADARVFSEGQWNFVDQDGLRTLHHVGGDHYMAIGDSVSML